MRYLLDTAKLSRSRHLAWVLETGYVALSPQWLSLISLRAPGLLRAENGLRGTQERAALSHLATTRGAVMLKACCRTRLAFAFEEKASELEDTVSVLTGLSSEAMQLLDSIAASCGA